MTLDAKTEAVAFQIALAETRRQLRLQRDRRGQISFYSIGEDELLKHATEYAKSEHLRKTARAVLEVIGVVVKDTWE